MIFLTSNEDTLYSVELVLCNQILSADLLTIIIRIQLLFSLKITTDYAQCLKSSIDKELKYLHSRYVAEQDQDKSVYTGAAGGCLVVWLQCLS